MVLVAAVILSSDETDSSKGSSALVEMDSIKCGTEEGVDGPAHAHVLGGAGVDSISFESVNDDDDDDKFGTTIISYIDITTIRITAATIVAKWKFICPIS